MKILYTGSFNPFHNGHQYVYDVACKCFGKENVWIGIGRNRNKNDVNIEHLKFSIHPITRNVLTYDCLTADIVLKEKFDLIVRGVRPGRSLEDENDLLYWNRKLSGGIETILIPTPPEVNMISSGAIRELVFHGENVNEYMNKYVYLRWINKKPLIKCYFGKCCCGKTTYLKDKYVTVIEMDKQWKVFARKYLAQVDCTLEDLKRFFYDKNDDAFFYFMHPLMKTFDWNTFFSSLNNPNEVFDIPVIGMYFEYLPDDIVGRLELINVTTSEGNRLEFAKNRNVNPRLIECNNHFYKDPPFWDKEIIIDKK